jgi:multiple sugar transport system substrate-binding protein
MKKALVIACAALILLGLSGCQPSGELVVWSFTDEVGGLIENYYMKKFPNVKIDYSLTPTEQFPSKLDPVLTAGLGAPDVFALESAFVRKYVESGLLLDLTSIANRNRSKLLQYPIDVGTYEGKVYGMSWQACPGAFFYRRSLARKYLGTDNPATVQTYFTDLNKFLETARLLKDSSNGSCLVVSSLGDLQFPFYSARQNPWVVSNRLVIDPVLDQYLEISKTLHDNGWEGRVGQWSEGWFAGMKGELRDDRGSLLEVFGYFLPTWGLHYVLKSNAGNTAGDWAMIQGPVPYRWGGTWLGAWAGTKNRTLALQMIEWLTTNDEFLEEYAKASGDMVSNLNVVNKIKDTFSEPFLGGQNHYAEFAEMAKGVNGRLTQSYDDVIQGLFGEAVTAYVEGEKTKEQALSDFRDQVRSQVGIQ